MSDTPRSAWTPWHSAGNGIGVFRCDEASIVDAGLLFRTRKDCEAFIRKQARGRGYKPVKINLEGARAYV